MDGTDRGTGSDDPALGCREDLRDGTVAVQELDLDLAAGELVVLVGPSGCGKSTTLKMINRLIEPTTGTIELDGEDVTRADPVKLRRGIGYVIQQFGLFPHQKIVTNVMTVPLLYGESKSTARTAPRAARPGRPGPSDVRASATRTSSPGASGSGRRGPGAGREPAGATHGRAVRRGRPGGTRAAAGRVPRLLQRLGRTVVIVTHDIDEAVRMGDRVAVFADRRPARAVRHPRPSSSAHPADDLRGGLRRRDQEGCAG